jgi:Arc/MetJ family transcription regulator
LLGAIGDDEIADPVGPDELTEGELVDDQQAGFGDLWPESRDLAAAWSMLLLQLESHGAALESEPEVGRVHGARAIVHTGDEGMAVEGEGDIVLGGAGTGTVDVPVPRLPPPCHEVRAYESRPSATAAEIYPENSVYPASVAKHLVDLDEDLLSAARAQLGTGTIKDTVNEALRRATHERQGRVAAALDVLAGASLDDRSEAWR